MGNNAVSPEMIEQEMLTPKVLDEYVIPVIEKIEAVDAEENNTTIKAVKLEPIIAEPKVGSAPVLQNIHSEEEEAVSEIDQIIEVELKDLAQEPISTQEDIPDIIKEESKVILIEKDTTIIQKQDTIYIENEVEKVVKKRIRGRRSRK